MLTVEVYLKDIRKIQFSKVLNLIQLYYISLYSIYGIYIVVKSTIIMFVLK